MPLPSDLADIDFLDPVDEIHTPEKPFCYNPSYPCHEDGLLIYRVYLYVQDGLMTPEEATDFVAGKGI